MARNMGSSPSSSTFKTHQVAMVGGEVAPALWYRSDLEKIKVALAKCRNFIPFAHGGTSFRPGTWYVSSTKNNGKAILIPMSFTSEPSVHIEVGHQYMRFFVDGEPVIKNGVPYEISAPYELADLPNIRYVQSADVLYIVDGRHRPQQLKRYANDNWSIEALNFKNGPFMKENDTDDTLTISSYNGSTGKVGDTVTVTSSSNMFTSSDVGRLINIRYVMEAKTISKGREDPAVEGVMSNTWDVDGQFEIIGSFDGSSAENMALAVDIQYSVDGGSTWQVFDSFLNMHAQNRVKITGELNSEDYNDTTPKIRLYATGDINWFSWILKYSRQELNGILEITQYISPKQVRCKVKRKCFYLNTPTKKWSLGAWGDVPGWPAVITFHQDRLTLGRTPTSPFDIWQSVTGDYNNFGISEPVEADDSVKIPIRSRSLDEIQGLISLKDLIVLTTGGEWRITGSAEGNAITPDSMYISSQGYRGSHPIEPIISGASVLFVQKFGKRVRDLAYSFESDGYDSVDLSIFATHLFDDYTIVDWCYQQEPWSVLWVVRSDGKLLGLTYMKEQEVWAWHMHDVGGIVESISSAPGLTEDEVYMIVKRNINGSDVRYVEKLSSKPETMHLDCAVVAHDGDPTTIISGLNHLNGKQVVVLADGVPIFGHTVQNGTITLKNTASYVVVGLQYIGTIQSLPLIYEAREGISTGSRRRATNVILQVLDSRFGYIGTREDDMYPIYYPNENLELYSGVLTEDLSSEYDYYGQVTIEQRHPYPFNILNWTVRVAHGD
jgi:hypothetical protein